MLLVLGSINTDLTTVAAEIPNIGETVIGKSFSQYAGGKGANQAVCAARLGSDVCFLGKVGNDAYGDFLLQEMEHSGIDVSRIEKCEQSTGIAAISVDAKGQNSIIVAPGANFSVDCEYVDRHVDAIEDCEIMLAQHETPIQTTEHAFHLAKERNRTTILNPSPAQTISEALINATDILVPNEHELARLTGLQCHSLEEIWQAAQVLRRKGAGSIIITMGQQGAMYVGEGIEQVFPAFTVDVVDTTAAGDSFLGGFTTSYLKTGNLVEAITYGQMVASYSIQHKGAQNSMPYHDQLTAHMNQLK